MPGMNDRLMKACTLSKWKGVKRRCRWCNNVLGPKRRRWCCDECPRDAGRHHWWGTAREAALERDGWRCTRCPSRNDLEVHHRAVKARGRHGKTSCCHHIPGLETLCGECHRAAHAQRKQR